MSALPHGLASPNFRGSTRERLFLKDMEREDSLHNLCQALQLTQNKHILRDSWLAWLQDNSSLYFLNRIIALLKVMLMSYLCVLGSIYLNKKFQSVASKCSL